MATAMASEHHLFEIAAYNLSMGMCCGGTCWSSSIGGYDWHCTYSADSNGVSLSLAHPYHSILEPHNARFKLSLLDREGRPVPSRTRSSSFQNCCSHQGWKWTCDGFITMEDLERPEYLKDGSFTIRCDVSLKPSAAKADAFVTVPPSDLHQHLGSLLASKEGADVTFQLAAGGGTRTFSAHRCVLVARSPCSERSSLAR
ncbi:hypothetical protein BS78_K122500 [Paspalum vaginatum]|uniref:MATH domain-containing protein n=1 Tax=Paspalum vaginatum TaxID=158149 RepID=A0A9W8CE37_9POAL|nr:hypothetical protein BS78_K122500 [Paspalum vaginatum]